MALYSTMTAAELDAEMERLQTEGQQAYDEEHWSEYEVLMQKWYLAKSYRIHHEVHIIIGKTYRLAEEYDRLTVTKIEGVMAWGIRESNAEETAVPLAMLADKDDGP